MSLNSIIKEMISKEELNAIFKDKTKYINNLLSIDDKIKQIYLINDQDKKIFNFLLICFRKSKLRNLKVILRHRKIDNNLIFQKKLEELYKKVNLILSKFFHVCIYYSSELCKIFCYKNENFIKKMFHLVRIYYLHNLLDKENLVNIIRLKLYSCFYDSNHNINIFETKNKFINKIIVNISPLETIIDFLLSFTQEEISQKKIHDFNNIINDFSELIKNLFLYNYNNIFLLSNSLSFYRLIELGKISLESINRIIPLLKTVYKFSFKLDFYLNDLSEQFLLKKNENLERKNNNIISKNKFLEELFGCEKLKIQNSKINHGFVFNDNPNNGLVFYANDSFNFPKEFSMVISFKLMKIDKENNKDKKYCIFSISETENFQYTKYVIFIENKKLKILANGKIQELFDENIIFEKEYVFWIFSDGINKKNKTIFYLNEKKVEKNVNYSFPTMISSINLGFQDFKQQNNFEGILGTYILFNKCFIKSDPNPNNIKQSVFFEKIFLKLRCNYEDIIYINYQIEYSSISDEIQEILNELNSDNISRFIEVIISSKSVVSNDFCCSNRKRKVYKANYFYYKNDEQERATLRFKSEKISPILDNYNFNSQNCLITYPIHLNNSFDNFINNEGIKFLEMELYYFIGVIEYYNNNNLDYLKNNTNLFCEYIQIIFKLFLSCITELSNKQEIENKDSIEQFFYTFNNLLELKSKTGFKIDYKFLISISSYIDLLIKKINFCEFILNCENYDFNDDKTLDLLFQTILIDFDKHYDEFLSVNVFSKTLNFSNIFKVKQLKFCKKSYSVLIQNILSKILDENKIECLSLYIQKIKDLQIQNKPTNFLYDNITEEIPEENEINLNPNKKKLSMMSSISKNNFNFAKLDEKEKEREKKEQEDILLMYKLLKNFYLCLDIDKKRSSINKLVEISIDQGEKMVDFFNNLFNYFYEKYDIKKELEENSYYDIHNSDDENDDYDEEKNENVIIYKDNNKNENKEEVIDEEIMKKFKYIEYMKSICIRFIDEMCLDNIKSIPIDNPRFSIFKKQNNNTIMNSRLNASTFYKSGASSSYNLKNYGRNTLKPELYLNTNKNSTNKLDFSIDAVLSKIFQFFNEFTISPYTFNSFFLVIFRNWTSREKLKFIKSINEEKSEKFKLIIEKKKNLKDVLDLMPIILQMIQRVGKEEYDTLFMNRLDLLEFVYNKYKKFIFDIMGNITEDNKTWIKNIIKTLFCQEDLMINFYLFFFDSLKAQKEKLGSVFVVNSQIQQPSPTDNENSQKLENIFSKVENDMKEIINKTIFEYIDLFYFKLLFSMYRRDYNKNEFYDFILRIIQHIIEKLEEYEEKHPFLLKKDNIYDNLHIKVGLNNKNLLLLIYQITFFNSRKKYLINNGIFEKKIVLYLTNFLQKKQLIFLKIFFPIEEKEIDNKINKKKLIIEMLFEIFINLYQNYKEINNPQYYIFENLINELFQGGQDDNSKRIKKKNIRKAPKTLFYEIDEWNLVRKFNEFTKNFFCYLKDLDQDEQGISVTILFLIKLTIYIKILETTEKNSPLIDFFIETSEILCKNAKLLQQTYTNYKPLLCSNSNLTQIYEDFTSFILNEYNISSIYNKEDLISKINYKSKEYKRYTNVDYSKEGKARLISINSNINLLSNEKKKNFYNNSMDEGSQGKSNNKEDNIENYKGNLLRYTKNSNSTNELTNLTKDYTRMSSTLFNAKKEKKRSLYYKIIPSFLKSFLRTHFSIYFIKLLTYDKDFITIRKIYNYLYHNEIDDINNYNLNYPSKLKNRLGNIYVKHFLKKDFNFNSSQYFPYSHKCIYNRHFVPSTKVLFPSKKILEEYNIAHKEIREIIKNKEEKILSRSCELITYDGAIFGYIYFLENCILFLSDIKNDKRKIKDLLEYACCSMEFDFLEKDTIKVIEYTEIKNVFPRKFIYSWMSLEIFMKYGKSYLFNFFDEVTNEYVLDLLKNKNVKVIKNAKEYFDKKDYAKKWRDGKKSTYDYLLILNKFSSRTYNDSNQYPLMPWTFMEDRRVRNFDIPMSVQNPEAKERFLKMPNDQEENQNRWHSNHYSTSAYICYYLMRINPFTESMIKFQSNNFDVPERQFSDMKQTLILCENNNNNREPVPELYTIPEAYINLNYNDFGVQTLNKLGRIHNVKFSPYASNAYEFIYNFKYRLNNNEETNTNINMWFDFIFGINQYSKDNLYGEGLRNFNKYCYGQNINIKKLKENLRKKHKTDSEIYSEIKTVLGMIISFGQCPFQILTYAHPKRIYTKGVHNIVINSADKQKLNKDEQELMQVKEKKENELDFFLSYDMDESMVQKAYDDNSRKNNIIYFNKSIFKKNLYCILNNKEIEVYQKSTWNKDYRFVKKINVSRNYLLFKKNKYGYPILKPEFLFCELKEEHFIFCRYLDNSIKLISPNMETSFLLDSFITCVIRINETEFITGDNKGKICHWKINFDIMNTKIKLIKKVKSNKNNITAMLYNKKLNIVIIADNNTIVIRSFYDFEFLTYIDTNNLSNEETIVDVKCSNYDFIYTLINKGNNYQEIRGYSLNGICFGKYEEKITNFEITSAGKILVGLADKGMINVLNPVTFQNLFSRFIVSNDIEYYFYHFYFEEPNIIFLGFKDNEGAKIKIIQLNNDEIKTFI